MLGGGAVLFRPLQASGEPMGAKYLSNVVGVEAFAKRAAHVLPLVRSSNPLAHRKDFRIGNMLVRPSLRLFEGAGARALAEPRVMRVMLALADASGAVLSREDLTRICWDDLIVGDESINRAIFELRRIGRTVGGDFEIETIPRVGYRLLGEVLPAGQPLGDKVLIGSLLRLSVGRRGAIGGALAALTIAGLTSLALLPRPDPRAAALRLRGEQALRDELPDSDEQGVGFLREAAALEPESAAGWGLLALAFRNISEHSEPGGTAQAVQASERATARAIAIDPREANALAAQATLRPEFGDWYAAEDRLRAVLAKAPDHAYTLASLGYLYESVGRSRESKLLTANAASLQPLSPVYQYRLAYKHWILGQLIEADQVIDRAVGLWPRHPSVIFARLLIYAWTGRTQPALDMLNDNDAIKAAMPPRAVKLWRLSIEALRSKRPGDKVRARDAQIAAATRSPGLAVIAVQMLSLLGFVNDAFAVAEGYLLRHGSMIGSLRLSPDELVVNDQERRKTVMLFNPCTKAMRADGRFSGLVEAIGLFDYWKRRGIKPDFQFTSA